MIARRKEMHWVLWEVGIDDVVSVEAIRIFGY